jgi:hypothetical protein
LTNKVYFGVTVRHFNGEFAGKFQTIRSAAEFQSGQDFEVILQLQDFHIEPSLIEMKKKKNKLPSAPFDLAVESFWCHTLDQQSGLEIAEVELLPSVTSLIPEPPQVPIMDIWTAVSKGNLDAVKRNLASGADIDEAFVAPGIPASGATPLHLAVLSDQGKMAQFLIKKQANLNARARDEHGGTPLHWAAVLGRVKMTERLITSGADVNARDNNGYTPLDWTNYERISEGKARLEIAEFLREKGGKLKE